MKHDTSNKKNAGNATDELDAMLAATDREFRAFERTQRGL